MTNSPSLIDHLPVDLQQLVHLVCLDPFVQSLVHSTTNQFFAPSSASPPKIEIAIDSATNETCWGLLPKAWRGHFDSVPTGERDAVLAELSVGRAGPNAPASLTAFLDSCLRLSLNRDCSPVPVLPASPPANAAARPSFVPAATINRTGKGVSNADRAGLSPKKAHEVVNLATLTGDILQDGTVRHAVDVGSGRAHLSRALARPPLDLHVLAVDWSASQTAGAERLDQIVQAGSATTKSGSLTHTTNSLDAPAIQQVLQDWPVPAPDSASPPPQPALLVALHACGNLTPDSLTAFVTDAQANPSASPRRMIAVGCCYNLLTPSTFPMSALLRSLPSATLERDHLRLTPQSPPTWHLSPASTAAWKASLLKLAHRARLEVELALIGEADGRSSEKRVGRLPAFKGGYDEYRRAALVKFGAAGEVPAVEMGIDWDEAMWRLQVFWTIRSWVGPVAESLLVVDRWAFLKEGLPGREVEAVNVFEQSTGSLRNLALVVR